MDAISNFLRAIASILSAVAWPAVVLFIGYGQRERLADLLRATADFIHRLKEMRVSKDGSVIFRECLEEISREAIAADTSLKEPPPPAQIDVARQVQGMARAAGLDTVRQQVYELARDYERIRHEMSVGAERTRQMEAIVTKMRVIALAARPLLSELTAARGDGPRLAAASCLQVQPDPTYLDWLAELVAEDPGSFHGYHAALALLSAAQKLDVRFRDEILRAIKKVRETATPQTRDADAFKLLDRAEAELRGR